MKQRDRRHRCYTREGALRRRLRIVQTLVKKALPTLAAQIEADVWALAALSGNLMRESA